MREKVAGILSSEAVRYGVYFGTPKSKFTSAVNDDLFGDNFKLTAMLLLFTLVITSKNCLEK